MIFKNRVEAGQKLARALQKYQDASQTLIVGLPRGGVVVAAEVAEKLNLPLEVLICRKIGARFNPEFAVGAICEGGQPHFSTAAQWEVPEYLDSEVEKQKQEIARQKKIFRGSRELQVRDQTVILVDDGIATGQTVLAGIAALKNLGTKKIVVATPVAAPDTVEQIRQTGAEIVALETPPNFAAVGQFYVEFPQTTDQEVKELIAKFSARP